MQSEFKDLLIGAGLAQADNAVNRRRIGWRLSRRFPFLRHGVSMAPNPGGIKDETIRLLRLGSNAVIWNYACHPVFMPRLNHVSADFIGFVRRYLRAKLGAKTAVLFWQGFSGDVYPSFAGKMVGLAASLKKKWLRTGGEVDVGVWTVWAERLAEQVESAYRSAVMQPTPGPVRVQRVSCPVADLLAEGPNDKSIWAHRIQIGADIDIVGMSAEIVTAYGPHLRKIFGSPNLLCVGCTDGVFGYLPTSAMVREGGYEAVDFFQHFSPQGRFRDDVEQVLQTRLVESLDRNSRG